MGIAPRVVAEPGVGRLGIFRRPPVQGAVFGITALDDPRGVSLWDGFRPRALGPGNRPARPPPGFPMPWVRRRVAGPAAVLAAVLAAAVWVMILVVILAAGAPASAAGPRAASATLCGDQHLLKLADPDQIVALSPQAAERWLSLLAEKAAGFARVRPSAESYLSLGVEIVLTDAWSDRSTTERLERFGVRVLRLPLVERFEDIERVTASVAEALGHPERGAALNAATRDRLAALRAEAAGAGRRALYLRPGGGSAAAGTFVDAVMAVNGLSNQATAEGRLGWTAYDLERFVLTPPELLVTSFFDSPERSLSRAFGNHPAFTRRAATVRTVEVPGRSWACSGWFLVEAAEAMADGLRRPSPLPSTEP